MKKRIAATVLWFHAGWFAGAFFAFAMGMSPALAPLLAMAAAAIVAVDPRRMIWAPPSAVIARSVGSIGVQHTA